MSGADTLKTEENADGSCENRDDDCDKAIVAWTTGGIVLALLGGASALAGHASDRPKTGAAGHPMPEGPPPTLPKAALGMTIGTLPLTNDNTPTITGTAPAGSVIDIFEGATKLGSTTTDPSGNWSFTPTQPLSDGNHTLTVKTKDAAGNEGSKDTTVAVDTVAPVITISVASLTNDSTPDVTGTAPSGSVIDIFEGATKLGSATTDASGNWSFTPTEPLADGNHTLTAKTKDAAGNEGTQATSVVIDTVTPTLTVSTPSMTNDSTPTISGTAPAGSVVDVYEGPTKLGSATTDAAGDWSFTPTEPLADGNHTLTAKTKDAAGNEGTQATSVVIDTVTPTLTVSTPSMTNDSTPTISGTAPAGSVVDVYEGPTKLGSTTTDASGNWSFAPTQPLSDGNRTLTAKTKDAAGNEASKDATVQIDTVAPVITVSVASLTNDNAPTVSGSAPAGSVVDVYEGPTKLGNTTTDPSGNWSFTPTQPLSDGNHTLTAKTKDAAGNEATQDATVVIDTVAPTLTVSAPSTPSETNDNTPTISGTAPAGSVVDVYEGPAKLGSSTTDASGNWTFAPTQPLSDGNHTLTAKTKDGAGNEASKDAAVVIDTVAPAVTITAPSLTNDNKPSISGTAPAGSEVDVYEGPTKLGSTTTDASGNWTFAPTQPLSDGNHTLTAKTKDAAGNEASKDAAVVIDTVAPAVTITAPSLTNDNKPSISGTAPAGSQVDVYEGPTKLGSATTDASGNWSFTPSQPLADGNHTLTAKTKDAAGNEASKDAAVVIDSVAPAVSITAPSLSNHSTPTVSGTAPAGSQVDVYEGPTKLGSTTTDASGNWSFTPTQPLADGNHTLTAKTKDAAGNEATKDAMVAIDTVAPVITISVASLTNDNTPDVTGTAPAGSVIDLFEGATKIGSATTDASGNWSFTPMQPLADGNHTLTAKTKDGAGNEASKDAAVVIDTVAPALTVSAPSLTNDSAPTVSGSAPAGSVVDVYEGATKLGSATTDASGNWSFTPTQPLGDGNHTLTAKSKDAAGNEASKDATVAIDTVAPTLTVSAPSLTNDNTPTVSGSAPAGSVVDVYEGPTRLGRATTDPSGNWSFTPTQPLSDGNHTLTAKTTDAAGNEATEDAPVAIDTVAPVLTVSAPSLTNDSTPDVTGTAPAGSVIDIFEGVTKLGSATTDLSGNWSFTPTQPLSDGNHTLTAKTKDAAGNEGVGSAQCQIDTAVYPITLSPQPTPGLVMVNGELWLSTATGSVGITAELNPRRVWGPLEQGATWFYRINGEASWHQGGSDNTLNYALLKEGRNDIEMFQKDLAGNESTVNTIHIARDAMAPEAVTMSPSKSGNLWTQDSIQVNVSRDEGTPIAIDFRVNGGNWWTLMTGGSTISLYNVMLDLQKQTGSYEGDALIEARARDTFHSSEITSLLVHISPVI